MLHILIIFAGARALLPLAHTYSMAAVLNKGALRHAAVMLMLGGWVNCILASSGLGDVQLGSLHQLVSLGAIAGDFLLSGLEL